MISFLILTAFIVSIDSFICGFYFGAFNYKKYKIVLLVSLTVFVMCLFTNYLSVFLSLFLHDYTSIISGIILILVGLFNLLKKEPQKGNTITTKNIFITGFAVGIDGAMANLSLSLMGINGFYVPLIIALFHAIMISLGIVMFNFPVVNKIKKYDFIAPLILMCLGIYKIITVI